MSLWNLDPRQAGVTEPDVDTFQTIPGNRWHVIPVEDSGPAHNHCLCDITFDTEAAAFAAIQDGTIQAGDAVIIRWVGPQGGPGMPEMLQVTGALVGAGLGSSVALITDAGTPGISDPGSRLVRAVLDTGHRVTTIPGPAAFVAALVISGLDTTRFVFDGFLPRSGGQRTARLAALAAEAREATLAIAAGVDGEALTVTRLRLECVRGEEPLHESGARVTKRRLEALTFACGISVERDCDVVRAQ